MRRLWQYASLSLLVAAAMTLAAGSAQAGGGKPAGGGGSSQALLTALGPEFYIATNGNDAPTSSVLAMGITKELSKALVAHPPSTTAWLIPQPQWSAQDIANQCQQDPQAVGGIALLYYQGYATHFFLLWQSETTTVDLFAEIIACNHTASGAAAGVVVATIVDLPGANGTDWQVRRTQVSIPLITVAGVGAALAKGSTSSTTTSVQTKSSGGSTTTTSSNGNSGSNVSTGVLLGSIFSQASSRDIPGYSDPIRLRHAAQHVGVDVVFAMQHFCNPAQGAPAPSAQLATICKTLGFSP